jgi:DNA uptake protein ComE-like DNA-binding protein
MAVGAIAVLSILAIGTTSGVLQELKLAKFVRDSNVSVYEAESLVLAMRAIWPNGQAPYASTLYGLRPRTFTFGGDTAEVVFTDEESKININTAPSDILARMPGLSGQQAIIDSIAAASFSLKEELLLIEGVTEEIYGQLKDLVTTYGAGSVNINTASGDALAVLGMDDDLIDKIRQCRAGNDTEEMTEDDKVFSSSAEILPLLEPYSLNPAQRAFLEGLISFGRLGTSSNYIAFDVSIKKSGLEGKTQKINSSFHIILDYAAGKIVQWYEG